MTSGSSAGSAAPGFFGLVDRAFDLPALEQVALTRWRETKLFERTMVARQGAPEWVFYEGPPTANGRPGLHHVWARVFKDLYPRFQTMRGHHVARKGGWDCHGLPVELEVEKELGFTGKAQIEAFGIEAFNARCRASVERYVGEFERLTERIGMWVDTDDAYWTLTNDFIESVWWLIRQMWDQGLIYEGFKVVPYCGRCGTALSSHEVALGYEDITEPSVYVRFPLDPMATASSGDGHGSNTADAGAGGPVDLLVWTTTPWTLISNIAVAIGPDVDYVRVRGERGRRDVIMAAGRVAAVLGEDAEVLGPVRVDDLVGRTYERPFSMLDVPSTTDGRPTHRVVLADFVTTEDGSGIVHLAPAFGEVDREVSQREGLPVLNPVDPSARFTNVVTAYAGMFVKDADEAIIGDLDAAGRLERVVAYTHSYPHCWRCHTPLIYYAKSSWFARTSERKAAMLTENDRIGWHPEHIRRGRFGDWLENNVDWALSRDRYWGTPIPVWRCENGHDTCIGSVAELSHRAGRDLTTLDLHRPFVDDVVITCAECDAPAQRVAPVLDTWFDSGSMPSAQFHHPYAADSPFHQRFPADFICEAIDQTRGWFYSLLAVNTLVFGQSPYKNVVCLAHVVDKDGQKMSKSKGNVIDPWTILDSHGADALRWYFFSAGSPWTNRRVYIEGIDEAIRSTLLTLWNTYSFFVTYANLDGFSPATAGRPRGESTHVLDRWLRSRVHTTTKAVTACLDDFDALGAAQSIAALVDDLSNWYVRRSRPRFWKASDASAHATLHESLLIISQLLAPLCPFFTDEMFRNLTAGSGATSEASVHLSDWPVVDVAAIDTELEAAMERVRRFVSLGRTARTDAKVRVRQPLPTALLYEPGAKSLDQELSEQIADELNVKAVQQLTSLEGLVRISVVPNFRALGPRLGPRINAVKQRLTEIDGSEVEGAFAAAGRYELLLDGETIELQPGDVELRAQQHEAYALARDGSIAVALDLAIDDGLRREGIARELVRAINDQRKAAEFEIADRILVVLGADGQPADAARDHASWIAGEVLATQFDVVPRVDAPDLAIALDLDGEPVALSITRINRD